MVLKPHKKEPVLDLGWGLPGGDLSQKLKLGTLTKLNRN